VGLAVWADRQVVWETYLATMMIPVLDALRCTATSSVEGARRRPCRQGALRAQRGRVVSREPGRRVLARCPSTDSCTPVGRRPQPEHLTYPIEGTSLRISEEGLCKWRTTSL
jgi:hypothetical protein